MTINKYIAYNNFLSLEINILVFLSFFFEKWLNLRTLNQPIVIGGHLVRRFLFWRAQQETGSNCQRH